MTSWRTLAFCLATGLLLFIAEQARAQNDQSGDITVLVFESGRPVPGLRIEIGKQFGLTDADGAWRGRVEPGRTRLAVYEHALGLAALPLEVHQGEVARYIITLAGPQRRAQVSIESSHEGEQQPALRGTPEVPTGEEGSGLLVGRVVSTEDGSPVSGARVFVSGTPVEARTDEDGQFSVEVPTGDYAVSVLHSEFATRTVDAVAIREDSETRRDFELPPAGLELAEYVVVEPYIEGSVTSVIAEQRDSSGVANIIGTEQFSRSGDGDAGSALARVTGLTLVGGEFIFIRGLGERYSSTLLNGANVPSPDPTRKVVPLDLFPTGVIESIRVQKSYSPDLPGDFGGGVVEIRTRGIPEEDFLEMSVSVGGREGTTFSDGLTYEGGDRDFLGMDDGTRELPTAIAEAVEDGGTLTAAGPFNPDGLSPEELEMLGESFPAIYEVDRRQVGPDLGLSVEGGKLFEFSDDWTAGITTAVMWSDAYQTRIEERRSFIPLGDGSLRPNDDYEIERSTRDIELSGFLTAGLQYSENHRIDLTSMLLRQTQDETFIQEGFNLDEDGIVRFTELEWEERELLSQQLRGEHTFGFLGDTTLEWDYADSRARRDVPDQRRYRYDPDNVSDFIFSRRSDNLVRRFSKLEDDATDYGIDLAVPFGVDGFTGNVSFGGRRLDKSRDSSIRRFQFDGVNRLPFDLRRNENPETFFNPDFIGPGAVVIKESTRETDNYTALLEVDARYANLDMTFFERLRVTGGIRIEDWEQNVTTFQLLNPGATPVVAELADEDRLPAFSATWYMTENQQIRASYAETLVRPDFKELSPAPFTDPVLNREVIGNAELVPSQIEHMDLRWEYYPEPSELISLGIFHKSIINPIEVTVEAGVEQRLTYANADEAENYGAELEWRKSLGFLGEFLEIGPVWNRLYLAGNYSWVESEIFIEDLGILTNEFRPLQGQSPYVANVQIGYDDEERDFSATLLLNAVGERIVEVGVLGAPDKKEQPAPDLDLVIQWRWFDLLDFKAEFSNLLDSAFEVRQGKEITQRYTRGREFSLGVSWEY
ncbi:TonB-dependent receptor [Wenzhouxiangella sp. XN201]|uniref:TonB-dependent receptor n=1 Tax=Wenzhouxiangella sp. XN201 TaxID=2710755 RepID=UPI0013CCCC88|nr:TonB-dependent receptor [Wenzhouxiangella sp. XN201]NEZ03937.1 TonB-dependent receptor [Wenzhouxiangella sp. XN201]